MSRGRKSGAHALDPGSLGRVLVVVAHPDDEVLGCGGLLLHLRDVRVIHVTDGAPRDGLDARRRGFADWQSYAAARRAEAEAALDLAGIGPDRILALGLPDQGASDDLAALASRLVPHLGRADTVLTHTFEGGHPDHDAVAFAVHAGVRLASPEVKSRPTVIEMPFYRAGQDGWVRQRFLPDSRAPVEIVRALNPRDAGLKSAMAAAHRSQAEILADFDLSTERFRAAPPHDFLAPPEPLLYERHGWKMTRARWVARVRAAARALEGGCQACH